MKLKRVGSKKKGIEDLDKVLKIMHESGNTVLLTIQTGYYVMFENGHEKVGKFLSCVQDEDAKGMLEIYSDKYAEHIYDNQDLSDGEQEARVEAFPNSGVINEVEYFTSEILQGVVDDLLARGVFAISYGENKFTLWYNESEI